MTDKNYSLFMSGHDDRDKGLDIFKLIQTHPDKGQLYIWNCTSSHVFGQQKDDQYQRGGRVPSVQHCRDLAKWELDTKALDLSHNAGIRGNFYKLLPFEVTTIKGTKRSDIGFHYDGNAPGSLGCVVFNRHNWIEFDRVMTNLRTREGVTRIPFYPLYS